MRDDAGAVDTGADDEEPTARRRRSWPQRLLLGTGLGLVLFCMLGASVAGYALIKYGSINRVDGVALPQAAKGEPENYLIVAVDTREGHSGQLADTIMVLRVDPKSERVALTSFPRDLMVPAAESGETVQINSLYARDNGEQLLIDTLSENYDLTINHFVEVNFESFREVVDAVGGVPVWIPHAVRDDGSGLYIEQLGCVNLDGDMGLAFARSRKLQIQNESGRWVQDPLSDVNRVRRQQIFIQGAMSKALSQVRSNPLRVQELVNIGIDNIRLDKDLTFRDMVDLGEAFKGFDASTLEAYPLPVVDHPQNPNRLLLDEAGAEPMLNVFRGLDPGEIRPGVVRVTVLNGTAATDDPTQEREQLATDVSGALQEVGFKMQQPGDADTFHVQTTIRHAPDQEVYAQRLARHISSEVAIPTEVDPSLGSGQVTLVAGADFTTVHDQPTPVEAMPGPADAEGPGETAEEPAADETPDAGEDETPEAGDTPPTTTAAPTTTTTEQNDYIVGEPPPGKTC